MELILTKMVYALLVPPGLNIFLILLGLIVVRRFYRTGKVFIYGGFISLVLFSLPLVADPLLNLLEDTSPLILEEVGKSNAKAIVILGGGRNSNAPEYGHDTISSSTLERIRYAAHIQRKTKLPILVTGGRVYDEKLSEAEMMKDVLDKDFLAVVRWIEGESKTTYWNAVKTKEMLDAENIDTIILVTHASHMPRAKYCFEQVGFKVIPAPMGYHDSSNKPFVFKLIPSVSSLGKVNTVTHELLGRLWYMMRYF